MLKQKIKTDLTNSLKKGDQIICSTLRMLLAAIINKEKEKRYKISKKETGLSEKEIVEKSNLADEEVIEVISSEAKKRKEAILEFGKGGRQDLVEKEKAELEVLKKYLPEQLSEEEIRKLVQEAVDEVGAKEIKDMGKVMAKLMPKVKGRADGSLVSKIVRESLTSKND